MANPEHIAVVIIQTPETFVLQERVEGVDNGETGKKGLYGGKIEEGETPRQAVTRELEGESGLKFPVDDFDWLNFVHAPFNRNGRGLIAEAEVFQLLLPMGFDTSKFRSGVEMDIKQVSLAKVLGQLTSVASAGFAKFLGV